MKIQFSPGAVAARNCVIWRSLVPSRPRPGHVQFRQRAGARADSNAPIRRRRRRQGDRLQKTGRLRHRTKLCRRSPRCWPTRALASWARIALEAIPGPAPDEALRKAAGKLHGQTVDWRHQFHRRPAGCQGGRRAVQKAQRQRPGSGFSRRRFARKDWRPPGGQRVEARVDQGPRTRSPGSRRRLRALRREFFGGRRAR